MPSATHLGSDFAGQVVIVTGGGAGIGRAIVDGFAGQGAKLVIAGRNLEAAERAAQAVARDFAAESLAVETDVGFPTHCDALIDAAVRRFGHVDVPDQQCSLVLRSSRCST